MTTVAQTKETRLLPAPNTGKKYPSAPNMRMAKLTLEKHALIQ